MGVLPSPADPVAETMPAFDAAESAAFAQPFVLAIAGDSGSGKSTISKAVRALLGEERVTDLKLDDYHRFTRAERLAQGLTALNPAVHDLELMREHLHELRAGRSIRVRSYEHANGSFAGVRSIEPREVILARGLLGFPTDELRAAYDLAVFLEPEPDLLFRWKLRRDVRSRGYSETEVLKTIAAHLLDAKEFVLPQAERADLVVRYEVPDWDAPDSAVRAVLRLRRHAALALRNGVAALDRFGSNVSMEERGAEIEIRVGSEIAPAEVHAWAAERFRSFDPTVVGGCQDENGGRAHRAQLAFVEVLIALLTQELRSPDLGEVEVVAAATPAG